MEKETKRKRIESEGDIVSPYGFIYITTNKINGKRYIGQKKYDTASRWKSYIGSGYHLTASVAKHGKENFERVIVDWAYSLEELNQKEYDLIEYFGAVESKDYYNMIDGGDVAENLAKRNSIPVIKISTRKIFTSILSGADYCQVGEESIRLRMGRFHSFRIMEETPIFRRLDEIGNIENLCAFCGEEFVDLLYRDDMKKLPRCMSCEERVSRETQLASQKTAKQKERIHQLGVAERKLCRLLNDRRIERQLKDSHFLDCIDGGMSIQRSLELCDLQIPNRFIKKLLSEERPKWKRVPMYYVAIEKGKVVFLCQYPKDFLEWVRNHIGVSRVTANDLDLLVLYRRKLRGIRVVKVDSVGYQACLSSLNE